MDSFFKDTLPHNRAFSEMLRPAKEQVKHLSPDNIAQRSGAVFCESNGVLELQSLNQTVRIAVPEYTFSPRLEEWHQLVILHYLALADGTAVSDHQYFPDGHIHSGTDTDICSQNTGGIPDSYAAWRMDA